MKTSKYNVLVECREGMILYNQISGGMMLLDEDQFIQYRKAESHDFSISHQLLESFKQGMYVIDDDFDEVSWMHKVFLKKSNSHVNKGMTIAPTDKCNLDCEYCYEAKDQWILMPKDVVKKLKEFISVFVSHTPTKTFNVTWFGGEPTLHMGAIEEISTHISKISVDNGFMFGQNMITNGTTLDKSMRSRLLRLGIKNLQITVDGLKEDHDKKRPFRKSMLVKDNRLTVLQGSSGGCQGCPSKSQSDSHKRSSFDKIMDNIPHLDEEGFIVSVRVNLNEENFDSFSRLKNDLAKYKKIHVYPARINGCDSANLSKEKFSCIEKSVLTSFSGTSCMASQAYNLGISQTGKISKCWEHITNEDYVVGDIEDLNLAKTGCIDDYSPAMDPDCSRCPILPSCWGGCRSYNKFFEKGYLAKNYDGCSYAKWNIREKVLSLYNDAKRQQAQS